MRAALLWTINDYPAYAYMSGWSTSGKLACPYCASNTSHRRLSHGSKTCYLGHRRFLPSDHVWRNQGSQLDNTRERRLAPKRPFGDDVINELSELREITHGKDGKKHTIFGFGKDHNWKKHSIFFQLPYWKTLLVRHNLDVMHIEKNVFENVIGTMMSIDGKTKDSLNARLDLQEMGIRQRYHPEEGDNDGYSGNLSRCVNASERNISGMKTHDCHELCAKVLREDDLNLLDNQIMYPVERYLHKLKTYVRNKAHPEGSIAEGVLREMSIELHKAATHYVLQNCDEALPFVQEHKNILIQSSVDNVEESHRLQFSNWISKRVTELYNDGKVSEQMLSLARGPERRVTYYPGYYISGFRFHTLQRDENKKTQNSGIMVKGENQIDDVPWHGTLVDIVELRYTEGNRVVLFNCDWYDTAGKGTVETNPRNAYEMTNDEIEPYQEAETQSQSMHAIQNDVEDNEID
ncbi:hypothetical protein L3X38_028022 [Prunus dulcis]|uniref:DUF4218 domain-containing protein n=1 Tax=Prunus dulcis TaxID=3755 RepID=A0AAD4VNZ9_PRUDU|nr:hypothetical protein L3X38_028022 [Prunus dulcis]